MKTLASNEQTHDLDFEVIDGTESVRQRVRQRLLMQKGEYYLNTAVGIPYITDILRHRYDESLVRRIIVDNIMSVEDVTAVTDVTLELDNATRTLTFSANVHTIFDDDAITLTQRLG